MKVDCLDDRNITMRFRLVVMSLVALLLCTAELSIASPSPKEACRDFYTVNVNQQVPAFTQIDMPVRVGLLTVMSTDKKILRTQSKTLKPLLMINQKHQLPVFRRTMINKDVKQQNIKEKLPVITTVIWKDNSPPKLC